MFQGTFPIHSSISSYNILRNLTHLRLRRILYVNYNRRDVTSSQRIKKKDWIRFQKYYVIEFAAKIYYNEDTGNIRRTGGENARPRRAYITATEKELME